MGDLCNRFPSSHLCISQELDAKPVAVNPPRDQDENFPAAKETSAKIAPAPNVDAPKFPESNLVKNTQYKLFFKISDLNNISRENLIPTVQGPKNSFCHHLRN